MFLVLQDSWSWSKIQGKEICTCSTCGVSCCFSKHCYSLFLWKVAKYYVKTVGAERPFGKVNTKIDKLRKFSILIFKSSTQFSFHSDRASLPNVPGWLISSCSRRPSHPHTRSPTLPPRQSETRSITWWIVSQFDTHILCSSQSPFCPWHSCPQTSLQRWLFSRWTRSLVCCRQWW